MKYSYGFSTWLREAALFVRPAHPRAHGLASYRIACVLTSVLVIAFWFPYRASSPGAFDPLWGRVLMAALPMALALLPACSGWGRAHFPTLFGAFLYALMAWILALTVLNGFSPEYAVGALFTFVGTSLSFGSDAAKWAEALSGFLAFTLTFIALTAAGLAAAPATGVDGPLFLLTMASTAAVLFVALHARMRAEVGLRESEARHRAVLAQTSEGVFLFDASTRRVIEANPALCRLLGRTPEEMRGLPLTALVAHGPESIDAHVRAVRRQGRRFAGERRYRHKSGAVVDVEFSADLITYAGEEAICVVVRDARKRREAKRALREAKERAEEMLRLKTALLNNMSHELRTPLTAILGFAGVLAEEAQGEAQREFAELIEKNGRRLQATLNSVMDLARLESGGARLRREAVGLAEEAREAAELLAPTARQKNLFLRVEAAEEAAAGPYALLDRAAFHRILYNLIGNAIKFTEAGGVTVRLSAEDGWATARVIDTGVGMEAGFLPQMFDEFKQQSSGMGRSHEGVGLGLSITKRLVEVMEGEVSAESAPGEGTAFTVRFPLATAGAPAEADAATEVDSARTAAP